MRNAPTLIACAAASAVAMMCAAAPWPSSASPRPAPAVVTNELMTVRVKFDPAAMQLRGGRVVPAPHGPNRVGMHTLADVAMADVVHATRVFPQPDATLAAWRTARPERGGPELPDLTQYFELTPRPGVTPHALVASLHGRPGVLEAYVTPQVRSKALRTIGSPLQQTDTPDFILLQGYRQAGIGVDADYANTLPGGAGQGIRAHGIEIGWHRNHEDLATLARPEAMVPQTDKPAFGSEDHGTAAMGEVLATKNGKGVTGIAYEAEGQMTNVNYNKFYTNIGGAVTTALTKLRAGDVIFVEVGVSGCAPVQGGVDTLSEFEPAVYDAYRTAVAQGVHVVEASGNGKQDFDHECYKKFMPPLRADSGSIQVGAGGAGPQQGKECQSSRTPMSFTNFGRRVNLQGWGECVVTAGYGDLQKGSVLTQYTARFAGTSSAAPIVAGVVASLSGIAKAHGKTVTPFQMRDILVKTGQPQPGGDQRHIGPLPDLKAAIAALPTVWK